MSRTKVIGPPGTGKTTWMINEIAHLILEGYEPRTIVATTFTVAGRRAIRQKVKSILKDRGLSMGKLDEWWLGRTIHSICKELLGINSDQIVDAEKLENFAKAHGYNLTMLGSMINRDDEEYSDLMMNTPEDYYIFFVDWWRHRMYPKPEVAYEYFIRERANELPQGFSRHGLMKLLKNYDEWKQGNDYWDFTDFLIETLREGLYPEGIRVLACDEAQDFSPLLMNVTQMWGRRTEKVYYVGDYLQCLYTWAGGEPKLLRDMQCDKVVFLEQSHRVPREVWLKDKRMMERFKTWYPQDYLPRDEEGFVCWGSVKELEELVLSGKRIFVQHRTRKLVNDFADMLIGFGIPFKALRGRKSPIEKKEAHTAELLLKLRRGEDVFLEEIAKYIAERSVVPSHLYLERGAKAKISRRAEEEGDRKVSLGDLPALGFNQRFMNELVNGNVFSILKMDAQEKKGLERIFTKYKGLQTEIDIYNGTIHSYKGEECDFVFLNLDLTRRPMLSLQFNPQLEAIVWHVALTRAREGVYLLPPSRGASFPV